MNQTTPSLAATAIAPIAPAADEDDWLSGASACSIENGEDCEACQ